MNSSSSILCVRRPWKGAYDAAEANINPQHPADSATWIWVPGWHPGRPQIVRFTRTIVLKKKGSLTFHISADQRFQLSLNGERIATGPDRSDVEHWSIATYEVQLPAGRHTFSALVWWIPDGSFRFDPAFKHVQAPLAQMTWRGGFLFAADGEWKEQLTTGIAKWNAEELTPAVSFHPPRGLGYHVIGSGFEFDMAQWRQAEKRPVETVLAPLWPGNFWGNKRPGWRLCPTELPEQNSDIFQGGIIRHVRGISDSPWTGDTDPQWTPQFQALLDEGKAVRIPASTSLEILWDLSNYYCGYPCLHVSGGAGSRLECHWAESLYMEADAAKVHAETTPKGDRSAIDGKVFQGFGDIWVLDGKPAVLPALWWRSGRYIRIRIQTGNAPLVLKTAAVRESHYPLSIEGRYKSDDKEWEEAFPVLVRGMSMSAHETWVDCPYYEQLSYVGDDVTELSLYTVCRDARLTQRCIRLFDWSRADNDLVAERYPSRQRQDSGTYAMLYPRLLHDFASWRNDPEFVQARLPGLRGLIERCLAFRRPDGHVGKVAGWPFIDWVKQWQYASPAGVREGDSSLLNLHLVFALQMYSRIEDAYGDRILADRARKIAGELTKKTVERFWDASRSLLADNAKKSSFSEHAQAWGILSGAISGSRARQCLRAWENNAESLAPASIYFSHYILDALYQMGAAKQFHERLRFWKGLVAQGFCTTPEQPEPSRSDCHGWGAHPIFHSFASIAGIRPASLGFRTVRIAPMPGPLQRIGVRMPHPDGFIDMRFRADERRATIILPKGISGEFVWKKRTPLRGGRNEVKF
jgi:alpha-L-rhamnosidase